MFSVTHVDNQPVSTAEHYALHTRDKNADKKGGAKKSFSITLMPLSDTTLRFSDFEDACNALLMLRTHSDLAQGITQDTNGHFMVCSGSALCASPKVDDKAAKTQSWIYMSLPDIDQWELARMGCWKLLLSSDGSLTLSVNGWVTKTRPEKVPQGEWCKIACEVERKADTVTRLALSVNGKTQSETDANTRKKKGYLDGYTAKVATCTLLEAVKLVGEIANCTGFCVRDTASTDGKRECHFKTLVCPKCSMKQIFDVGDSISYKEFNGCTIKSIGNTTVTVEIPGVGEKTATFGEIALKGKQLPAAVKLRPLTKGSREVVKSTRLDPLVMNAHELRSFIDSRDDSGRKESAALVQDEDGSNEEVEALRQIAKDIKDTAVKIFISEDGTCNSTDCKNTSIAACCEKCEYRVCATCWTDLDEGGKGLSLGLHLPGQSSEARGEWSFYTRQLAPVELPAFDASNPSEILKFGQTCPCFIASVSVDYNPAPEAEDETAWCSAQKPTIAPGDYTVNPLLPGVDPRPAKLEHSDRYSTVKIAWSRRKIVTSRRPGGGAALGTQLSSPKSPRERDFRFDQTDGEAYNRVATTVEVTLSRHGNKAKDTQGDNSGDGDDELDPNSPHSTGLILRTARDDDGVYVEGVSAESAAANALCLSAASDYTCGLVPGMRILQVEGKEVTGLDVNSVKDMMDEALDATRDTKVTLQLEAPKTYRILVRAADSACHVVHARRHGTETWGSFIVPDIGLKADDAEGSYEASVRGLLPGVAYCFWVQAIQADKVSHAAEEDSIPADSPSGFRTDSDTQPQHRVEILGRSPISAIEYKRPEKACVSGIDACSVALSAFTATGTESAFGLLYDMFAGRIKLDLALQGTEGLERASSFTGARGSQRASFESEFDMQPPGMTARDYTQFNKKRQQLIKQDNLRLAAFEWTCRRCGQSCDRQTWICCGCVVALGDTNLNPCPQDNVQALHFDESETLRFVSLRFRWMPLGGFGMTIDDTTNKVTHVVKPDASGAGPKGSAFKKGIRVGDTILSVGDRRVHSQQSANTLIGKMKLEKSTRDWFTNTLLGFGVLSGPHSEFQDKQHMSAASEATTLTLAAIAARARLVNTSQQEEAHWFLRTILAVLEASMDNPSTKAIHLAPFAFIQQHAELRMGTAASYGPVLEFLKRLTRDCASVAPKVREMELLAQTTAAATSAKYATASSEADKKKKKKKKQSNSSKAEFDTTLLADCSPLRQHSDLGMYSLGSMRVTGSELQVFADRPLESIATETITSLLPKLRAVDALDTNQGFVTTQEEASKDDQFKHDHNDDMFKQDLRGLRERASDNIAATKSLMRLLSDFDVASGVPSLTDTLAGFQALLSAMKKTQTEAKPDPDSEADPDSDPDPDIDIHSRLQAGHECTVRLGAVLEASFAAEYQANETAATELQTSIAQTNAGSKDVVAAKTELMIRAGRIWSPGLTELAACIMNPDREIIVKKANPYIERPGELFEGVAGILFRCIRLRQLRSCIAATQSLSDTLTRLLVDTVMVSLKKRPVLQRQAVDQIMGRLRECSSTPAMLLDGNMSCRPYDVLSHRSAESIGSQLDSYVTTETKWLEKARSKRDQLRATARVLIAMDAAGTDSQEDEDMVAVVAESSRDDKLDQQVYLAQRGCHLDGVILPDLRGLSFSKQDVELTISYADQAGVVQSLTDTVIALLCSKRQYSQRSKSELQYKTKSDKTSPVGTLLSEEELGSTSKDSFLIDPRFLVFEFVSPFMLRGMQVDILTQFLHDARSEMEPGDMNGRPPRFADEAGKPKPLFTCRSAVKQMIMGAGKTTVIAPLLCVLLADGQTLVSQVVPDALLAMSREVMYSALSTVFCTRVYTLEFERSSLSDGDNKVLSNIHTKAQAATARGGVMITTPNR